MSACRFEPCQCGIDDILGVLGGLIESVILNGVLLTCVVHCCCGSSALHTVYQSYVPEGSDEG